LALSLLWCVPVYLYLGYPLRAFVIFVASGTLMAMFVRGPVSLFEFPAAFYGFVLSSLLLLVLPIADIARLSGRGRAAMGRPYQRWYVYLGVAILSAAIGEAGLALRAHDRVALRSFSIGSTSMEPSLLRGEYVFSVMNVWEDRPIRRGDIVYFLNDDTYFVKRVIGLPGDKVELINGLVHVGDKPLGRAEVGPFDVRDASFPLHGVLYRETLPEGRSYLIGKLEGDRGPYDNMAAVVVPPDQVFVLGDNRDNSIDSRMPQMGLIALSRIKGRPITVFWSPQSSRIGASPQ
jgi:signal peptidase I